VNGKLPGVIELAMTTMSILDREGDKVFKTARGSNAPFVLRNQMRGLQSSGHTREFAGLT
jgi:hypothetical protein